jgi:hypothetical protein
MATYEIVSAEVSALRSRRHETVTGVMTRDDPSSLETHWTLAAVLRAMNGADRFVTRAANGRQARVQRYHCAECRAEHIRTHVSDAAIDDLLLHRLHRQSPAGTAPGTHL